MLEVFLAIVYPLLLTYAREALHTTDVKEKGMWLEAKVARSETKEIETQTRNSYICSAIAVNIKRPKNCSASVELFPLQSDGMYSQHRGKVFYSNSI